LVTIPALRQALEKEVMEPFMSVIKNHTQRPKKEIGSGLLNQMLNALGINKKILKRKIMEFIYPAAIKDDGTGNLLVTFRDIPFAATEGVTMQEALSEAQGCLETAIASCIKDKEDIPISSGAREGEFLVRLPAQTAAKNRTLYRG